MELTHIRVIEDRTMSHGSMYFFGHRECPDSINPILIEKLEDLIRNHNVDQFYVGNQGKFDVIVRSVLRKLSTQYPHIRYTIVLTYMPGKSDHLED